MKPTTLLLLLSLSAAVPARLISGTVNLTKDTTGINFINDTIQLVTNDTCKYPDCKRVYYCGDTSAPDFFFTPVRLGEMSQVYSMEFEIGSTQPFFRRLVRNIGEYLSKGLPTSKTDTLNDSLSICKLPYRGTNGLLFSSSNKLYVLGQTKKNLFYLLEMESYYSVIKFEPYTGEILLDCKGIHANWWLQPNGTPDFDEIGITTITKCFEISQLQGGSNITKNNLFTIRGERIPMQKATSIPGTQVIISNGRHIIINTLTNKNYK